MLCTLYFSNRYAINKTTVTVYLFSQTFDNLKSQLKVIEMSLITISITSQGKTKEVKKKHEMDKAEQEGPRAAKEGKQMGRKRRWRTGEGRTKTETRKERNNKGGKERDSSWKGHNYSKCLPSI